ncbi:DUF4124 domain-containing protein [Massilia sp. S19_KUP03_FR1]|uniref:DUF4124 domain-containing protein n=1 Tax=Massilia sp. S19_KUP03_FR1 TaxID=3025503 RepID=UPI002FCD8971
MNMSHPATSAALIAVLFCLFRPGADAQEIYKWTDPNGKVHYGDRAAAPEASQKIHVTAAPVVLPPATQSTVSALPQPDNKTRSVRVNPALVGSSCKGLIDKIAAVPVGQGWQALSREFNSACPGIAYECVEYVSNPQNNQCNWIERKDGNVLNRNKYP